MSNTEKILTPQDLVTELTGLFQENIEDPVGSRANKNERFVFDHFPKAKNLPRIGVHTVATGYNIQTIGQPWTETDADIQVSLLARRGKTFQFGPYNQNKPSEILLDYWERRIKEILQENQSMLREKCPDFVLPTGGSIEIGGGQGQNWHGRAITLNSVIPETGDKIDER